MKLASSTEIFDFPTRQAGPPLAPLLAGARARGVADGLEWLGLAAVLLDDRGEALHVNASAVELLGEELSLAASRLRARDPAVGEALNEAIADALTAGLATFVDVIHSDGRHGLRARVSPIGVPDDDPFQLLRVIVLLERMETTSRH